MLESEQDGAQQGVLTLPLMLNTGGGIDEVVVAERMLVGLVMPILGTHHQASNVGHLVGEGLREFPQRLMRTATRAVLVVEEFAAGREFPGLPVVHDVLREALPRR